MDVLEFECEEGSSIDVDEHVFDNSDEDEDSEGEPLSPADGQQSFEGDSDDLRLDGNTSINGLVDEMFMSSTYGREESTPPPSHDIPTDLDTVDGVPFGRSHHAERYHEFHEQQRQAPHPSPPQLALQDDETPSDLPSLFPFNPPSHLTSTPPATPPHHTTFSTPPLGRSTHAERILDAHEQEIEEAGGEQIDSDVRQLPPSPSPMRGPRAPLTSPHDPGLLPRSTVDNSHREQFPSSP